jgi:gamma-glutamylcysteine synthetase
MASKRLVDQYMRSFPKTLRSATGLRTIGRESEFPVAEKDGTAGDVQRLLRRMADQQKGILSIETDRKNGDASRICSVKNDDIDFTIEVGTGTIEMIHKPYDSLLDLEQAHLGGLDTLFKAADAEDLKILGYGIQPITPASMELMTKRRRYGYLYEVLGEGWKLFSATASEQIHVAMTEKEMASITSVCNGASGAIIGLCGNSGLYDGKLAPFVNMREMGKGESLGHRHGMSSGPVANAKEFLDQILDYDYLMYPPQDLSGPRLASVTPITESEPNPTFRPFKAHWLNGASYSPDFLFHDHYVWHSARPRPKQSTIEIRPACQQPLKDHNVVAALSVGMVQSHKQLYPYLSSLARKPSGAKITVGPDGGAPTLQQAWPELKRLHEIAGKTGLEDSDVRNFCQGVLEHAKRGLESRGLGEEKFLEPLFARIEAGKNPSQISQDFFNSSNQDMSKCIDFLAIRP